ALAEYFCRVRNYYERGGVELLCLCPQPARFGSAAHNHQYVFLVARVAALSHVRGVVAVHDVYYISAYLINFVGDDGNVFALAYVLDYAVDEEGFGKQTEHGIQPRRHAVVGAVNLRECGLAEHKERRRGDYYVGEQQRAPDV